MAKFIKTERVKPELIEIGKSIEVHADSLATFKTYVSRFNQGKDMRIKFEYNKFKGEFCKATRVNDVPAKKEVA